MPKYNFHEIYSKVEPQYEKRFFECLMQEIFDNIEFPGYECPVCGNNIPLFLPSSIRDSFFCPKCGSFDRHRLAAYYLRNHTKLFSKETKFLHFAPEHSLYNIFNQIETIDYYPVDLEEGPRVKETVDMCAIPYPENYFDIIYHSHVLEHIPDDIQAMNELYRCVKPFYEGGVVITMVPLFRYLDETFENEEYNTPELRLKHFGQEDHLRMYAPDIKDRLESVGFEVDELICKEFFDEKTVKHYGFYPDETLFICKKI